MKTKTEQKVITNLKDVLGLIEKTLPCRFKVDGREVELAVKRAMPALQEKRRELMRAVQPPYVKERNDYDALAPQYLARRDQAALQARSLTVYQCCPDVAAMKPGLLDAATIHLFVSGMGLPESILEMIELTALAGGLDLEVDKRANFTLPAGSES
jgi:hypothetical protein